MILDKYQDITVIMGYGTRNETIIDHTICCPFINKPVV